MKKRLAKSLFFALVIAIGMALLRMFDEKEFDLLRIVLFTIIAFIVDFIFNIIVDRHRQRKNHQ